MVLFPKGLKANSLHFWLGRVACMHSLTQEELEWIFSWQWLASSRIWRDNICFCLFIESQEVLRTTTFQSLLLKESSERARPIIYIGFFTEEQAVDRIPRLSNHCSFYITLAIFAYLIKEKWADDEANALLHLFHKGKLSLCSIILLL